MFAHRPTRAFIQKNSAGSRFLFTNNKRHLPTVPTSVSLCTVPPIGKPLAQFASCNRQPIRHLSTFIAYSSSLGSNRIMDSGTVHPPESEALDTGVGDFIRVVDINSNINSEGSDESVISVEEEQEVMVDRWEGGRRILPEELSRSVLKLECESKVEGGLCDVYLVGTAHVSKESCQEVQAVISFLKPEVVFLELCSSRVAILTPQNLKVPTIAEMVDMYKNKHNIFGILYSWFLAKVANKLEVLPGSEFRVAFEEAMKYGAKVILGDRPVQITLRRTWGKMPLWHKTKLLYSLLFQAFFLPSSEDLNRMLKDMDDIDMLTLVIQEMSKEFPTLMETLVHERDQYMSSTLLRVAGEHSSVVAVVGKGHLQGIRNHWKHPIEIKDLMELPGQKPTFSAVKIIGTIGAAIAGVAIISGIYLSSRK